MDNDTRPGQKTTADWRAALLAGITLRPATAAAVNRLGWPDYDARPALRWGEGAVAGIPAVVAVWDFTVYGGSFGERDARGFAEAATAAAASRRPLVSFLRSGGTRLQEGVAGLVGLPRAALALAALDAAGVGHIAVADQPTTGGVWVTIGSRADLRCAVRGATVGFAGPRVVAAATGAAPPPGSYTADSAYAAGLVDAAPAPGAIQVWLRRALTGLADPPDRESRAGPGTRTGPGGQTTPGRSGDQADRGDQADGSDGGPSRAGDGTTLPVPPDDPDTRTGSDGPAPGAEHAAARSGWAQVRAARDGIRPDGIEVLRTLLPDGVDLVGPDPRVVAGVGVLLGDIAGPAGATGPAGRGGPMRAVVVAVGARRGDAPGPAGYRLLVRAARLAGKLGIGLVTLVDTPGAANDADAEAAGIAAAIGDAMAAVLACPSPTLSIVLGEGGSGGALAAAVTDVVAMTPDSYFTALSPEGTAVTLRIPVERAANVCGLRPTDLNALGFADRLLSATTAAETARDAASLLASLSRGDQDDRLRRRQARWSTGLPNSL
ncbi:hypothetical protein ThrDRAFT_02133 [Frankia casuarinae]|uniref:carboxyl transferase domain-containing protein n=1 Tax=Frankia casuarinae (strain DSM 45818 / CECT 9043 / HFP020203 / CcI3) TaxID=106370 RepID=UPI000449C1DF|nr:carboxyl transferase domain-containing protein [Frankia casuarinae]EYT92175.1 hypothetical protein ThrDRAFT_02133 [Frankia casuarinae]